VRENRTVRILGRLARLEPRIRLAGCFDLSTEFQPTQPPGP